MYNFNLQNILEYRKIVVENIKKDIGNLEIKIFKEKENLRAIYNKIKKYKKKVVEKYEKSNKASEI